MKHVVKHDLSPELAKKATERAWEAYQARFEKYSPTAIWTSDNHANVAFNVKGFMLKGTIDLEPNAVALDLDVPLALRLFKKKAIEVIDREIRHWIDKAKAGTL